MNLSCAYMGYTYRDGRSPQLAVIASILLMLSLPTFVINGAIFLAIIKKRELKTPTYCIIANLAITDCLTGCTAYLFYAVVCIKFALGYDACHIAVLGTPVSYVLGITTYSTIAWQTIERYLAVFFPFRYCEKFTSKVALIGNLSSWVLSFSFVAVLIATKDNKLFNGILGSICIIFFFLNIFGYLRIFKQVRKIEKDMHNQQVFNVEERRKVKSNSKVAKVTVIILVSVIACFTPILVLKFYIAFFDEQTTFIDDTVYWAWLLALINSSVNPFIACRQLQVLRTAVLDQFKVFKRNRDGSPLHSSVARTSQTSKTNLNLRDYMKRNNKVGIGPESTDKYS